MTSGGKKAARRRERRQAALTKKRRRKALVWSAVGVALVAIVGAILFQPRPAALAEVERFPDLGGGHLGAGDPAPGYNSDPPTSGAHSPTSASCGIYDTGIPDEVQIHNLEHGTVVIQHRPDLAPGDVDALHEFARTKPGHILVAPRQGLSDAVVVTSWTRMLRMDEVDVSTIDLYYDQFAFTGPEVGVPCPFEVDESA